MKPWLLQFFFLSVLCLFSHGNALATSGDSSSPDGDKRRQVGAPLAEMMLYEAAEQAVEDGYGRIIPDPEEGAPRDAVERKDGHTGEATAPSNPESLNRTE